ncbi:MAG: DNA repair exonuclease [Gammaproteobacteria bacterium]|nr:DNA repair exonuclease [Gammaproteobacteria bacterium]
MVKFLHTADWQLGMTRHFLAGEAQARFDGARIDAIRALGKLAHRENCSFVVVCGDVFESNQVGRDIVWRAFDAMAETPEVSFFLLPGNHDPLDASSVYKSRAFTERQPANVVVLGSNEPTEIAPSVELAPAPWFSKRPLSDLVAGCCDGLSNSAAIRIVVGHGACDGLSPDPSNPALIVLSSLEEKLEDGLIHYVALGDRHSTTEVGQTGRIWYSGAPEPTDYDEVDPGNALVVELETDRISVSSRRVGAWRFVRETRELTGDADINALDEWLGDIGGKDRTILKLALKGQLSLAQHARLEALLEGCAAVLAALENWDSRSDLVVLPDDADLSTLDLSGFAREALQDLSEQASQGEQAQTARDALALLHRLAAAET